MKLKYRIGEYFTITSFVWSLYLLWLVPFQVFVINLTWMQFWNWLLIGTGMELIFTYPISKAVVRYVPRMTKYWRNKDESY